MEEKEGLEELKDLPLDEVQKLIDSLTTEEFYDIFKIVMETGERHE